MSVCVVKHELGGGTPSVLVTLERVGGGTRKEDKVDVNFIRNVLLIRYVKTNQKNPNITK